MKKINANHVNIFLVGFCFLAIYTSKAGLNIALAFLLIGNIVALFHFQKFKDNVLQHPIFIAMYTVFSLALIAKAISPGNLADLATTFRKGSFLLLTPYLTLLLVKNNHLTLAKRSLILGAGIAMLNSLYLFTQLGFSMRIESFWDVGRWGELVGYLFVGALPFILASQKLKPAVIGALFLTIALACLFLSQSRGAILGVAIVTFFYLLIHNRKILLSGIAVFVLTAFIFSDTQPVKLTIERVKSIADMNHISNSSRTLVWGNGVLFAKHHLETDPAVFLFGTNSKTMHIEFEDFLNTIGSVEEMQRQVGNQMSLRDFHNAYLNNLIKHGLVYFVAYLILLILLFRFFWAQRHIEPTHAWSGLNLLSAYVMFGVVYSNEMEFQTACLFFMLSIAMAGCLKAKTATTTANLSNG